jgi:hypothetical protein
MGNMFSVPILGAVAHSEETKRILKLHSFNRKQSDFIRWSIWRFAKSRNFDEASNIGIKPKYISTDIWRKIIMAQKKSYNVDYTYVIAFYWLLSLNEFKGYNKSKLMREIIESSNGQHL